MGRKFGFSFSWKRALGISAAKARLSRQIAILLLAVLGCSSDRLPTPPKRINIENQFAPYYGPVWAPDGSRLFFDYRPLVAIVETYPGSRVFVCTYADSLLGIYTIELPGQNQHRVYPRELGGLEMSADGKFLYYEDQSQIWRMKVVGDSLDESSTYQVTSQDGGAFEPSVDFTGNRLLFFGGTPPNRGVRICASTGGHTRGVGGTDWHSPDWMPNDSAFAFVKYSYSTQDIAVVDTFGAGAVQLRTDGIEPKWSPDGAKIAFLSRGNNPSGPHELWLMARDGSNPRQLTSGGVSPGFNWSPDGKKIAYVASTPNDTSYSNGTIWLIDPTTLAREQITMNPRP